MNTLWGKTETMGVLFIKNSSSFMTALKGNNTQRYNCDRNNTARIQRIISS